MLKYLIIDEVVKLKPDEITSHILDEVSNCYITFEFYDSTKKTFYVK